MKPQIYDDVLEKSLLKYVQLELITMSWHIHKSNDEDKNFFYFCPTDNLLSHNYLFNIFQEKFKTKHTKVRNYVNCYPPKVSGIFHSDGGDVTYLFFPDEFEKTGSLIFKNGPEIEYKTNRLVIFDAKQEHKAEQNMSDQMRHTIAWKTLI